MIRATSKWMLANKRSDYCCIQREATFQIIQAQNNLFRFFSVFDTIHISWKHSMSSVASRSIVFMLYSISILHPLAHSLTRWLIDLFWIGNQPGIEERYNVYMQKTRSISPFLVWRNVLCNGEMGSKIKWTQIYANKSKSISHSFIHVKYN